MSKIRINELARELEVKPNVILELLPELGVTDKKTHSSSLDDDVVLNLRRRVAGGGVTEETGQEPAPREEPVRQPDARVAEPAPPVAKTASGVAIARPKARRRVTPMRCTRRGTGSVSVRIVGCSAAKPTRIDATP